MQAPGRQRENRPDQSSSDSRPELPTQLKLEVVGEAAQLGLGARLAAALRPYHGIVYLRGDLGTGKTTLVRGLLRGLGYQGAVRSPTYTLIEPYDEVDPPVVHLDLYRLSDPEELEYLGLRDLLDRPGLILVEWPERGAGALPNAHLELLMEHAGDRRRVGLNACSTWAPLLAALSAQTAVSG